MSHVVQGLNPTGQAEPRCPALSKGQLRSISSKVMQDRNLRIITEPLFSLPPCFCPFSTLIHTELSTHALPTIRGMALALKMPCSDLNMDVWGWLYHYPLLYHPANKAHVWKKAPLQPHKCFSWAWWSTLLILILRRQKQEPEGVYSSRIHTGLCRFCRSKRKKKTSNSFPKDPGSAL